MNVLPAPSPTSARRHGGVSVSSWWVAGAAVAVIVGAALAMVLSWEPPPVRIVAVGSIGLLAILALAVSRLWSAVLLGVALSAVVRFEPAPSDAVFGVVLLIALVTGRVRLARVPASIVLLVGAFLVLNVVSAMGAVDPSRAALFFGITLYLATFAVWLAGELDSRAKARGLLLAYLSAAVFSAVLGALAMNVAFPGADFLIDKGGTRARALFEDANVFAPFLVPPALILLHEIIRPNLLRMRTVTKVLLFGLLALGILFSYSRAAWATLLLGIAVVVVVLALRGGYGGRLVRLGLIVGLAGMTVAAIAIATGSADFVGERASLQSYDQERFAAQRRGIALGEESPVGIGPGQYEVVVDYAAHSTYVRSFAEHGPLGLATIVGLLLATLILAARNAFIGRDTYGIPAAALLGSWCGLLLSSFVIDTLHWRHLWLVATLIWAGSMVPASRRASPQDDPGDDVLRARTDALLAEATQVRRQLSGVAEQLRQTQR